MELEIEALFDDVTLESRVSVWLITNGWGTLC